MIAFLVFMLTIVLSLLSQFPSVLESGLDAPMKAVWALPLGLFFFTSPLNYVRNLLLPFYFFVLSFAFYCVTLQLFTGTHYVGVDLYNMGISLMVTTVSFCFWMIGGSKQHLTYICWSVLTCCFLLATIVYFQFLRGENVLIAGYAFDAKNAIAPLLLCCVIISLRHLLPQNRTSRLLVLFMSCWCFIVMVLMRSRATLAGVVFMIIYIILKRNNARQNLLLLFCFTLIAAVLLLNDNFFEFVFKGILFAGRDPSDLDSISSGRFTLVSIVLSMIPNHPWIGNGNLYLDCMPVAMVAQYGICGASIVFLLLSVLYSQFITIKNNNEMGVTAHLLFIFFMTNSLFEAQPPFGSGMRCFLLWVFFGFGLAECYKMRTSCQEHNQGD